MVLPALAVLGASRPGSAAQGKERDRGSLRVLRLKTRIYAVWIIIFFSFKFRVYVCKQCVAPHAWPLPGSGGVRSVPAGSGRICCCSAWPGQAFPCTPPSSGVSRPEVEGLWAEGAPAGSPPGRRSGADVPRRAGTVRRKGRCEAGVLLQRHSLAPGLRRWWSFVNAPSPPAHPSSSCLKHDAPERSYGVYFPFFFLFIFPFACRRFWSTSGSVLPVARV